MTLVSPGNPTAQLSLVRGPESATPQTQITISIEVVDVEAVHAKAVAGGIPIVYPLTTEPWGVRRFHVHGPERRCHKRHESHQMTCPKARGPSPSTLSLDFGAVEAEVWGNRRTGRFEQQKSAGGVVTLMKTSDISQTPIVRRFGVRVARIYGNVCFFIIYLMLAAIAVGWSFEGPALFAAGWRGILVGCFVGSLLVFAASLLTRMRLKFLAELSELELQQKEMA